jgi:hypothetical protein
MTGIHSGKDGPFGQDFSMIMQESSGSDCPMGMSFSGKGVNPSYTLSRSTKDAITVRKERI